MNLYLSRDDYGSLCLWYLPQKPVNINGRWRSGREQPILIAEPNEESLCGVMIAPGECVLLDVNIAVEPTP